MERYKRRFNNLKEGTWALPFSLDDAQQLTKIFKNKIPADKAERLLWNLIGNDELFDNLKYYQDEQDVRIPVAMKLKEWYKAYNKDRSTFSRIWDPRSMVLIKKIIDEHGQLK